MKYFIDSAKLEEIQYAYEYWGIDGVTTNPKHIQASGHSFAEVLEQLAAWAAKEGLEGWKRFPISVESDPHLNDWRQICEAGRKLAAISPNYVVKIACTEPGLIAARKLEQEGIRTNITLVFSPSQAIAAAKTGALFVSPFVGWKEANGEDCSHYIEAVTRIYSNYGFATQIIVAALRSGKQIAEAALYGATICTCGLQIYRDSFYHPYTDFGLDQFQKAWKATKQ